jgi:hypothetical protein
MDYANIAVTVFKHWPDTYWRNIIQNGAHLRVAGNLPYAIDALQVAIRRPALIESKQRRVFQ